MDCKIECSQYFMSSDIIKNGQNFDNYLKKEEESEDEFPETFEEEEIWFTARLLNPEETTINTDQKMHLEKLSDDNMSEKLQNSSTAVICQTNGKRTLHTSIEEHIDQCLNKKDKPYRCNRDDCNSTFTRKYNRHQHENSVHRQECYKCPYEKCNSFIKSRYLKNHIREIHTKLKKQCESCRKWLSKFDYRFHVKSCKEIRKLNQKCIENIQTKWQR